MKKKNCNEIQEKLFVLNFSFAFFIPSFLFFKCLQLSKVERCRHVNIYALIPFLFHDNGDSMRRPSVFISLYFFSSPQFYLRQPRLRKIKIELTWLHLHFIYIIIIPRGRKLHSWIMLLVKHKYYVSIPYPDPKKLHFV